MGDVAMSIPIIQHLQKIYPDLKITALTKPQYKVLFDFIPQVKVVKVETKTKHKGISGLYKLSRELKTYNITDVADLHSVLRSKILCFFLRFQGQKIKRINKGRPEKKALIRAKRKIFKPLTHTTQRYANVFERLGFSINLNDIEPLKQQNLDSSVTDELKIYNTKKLIGIAPFAAHDTKVYPADLMQEVIKEIATLNSVNIYLFGGGKLEMSRLHNWAKPYKNVYCVAGCYDFKTEIKLISNLNLMLSMDSGNGHLAAMFGVKVLTLWGQTHPHAGFAPFNQTPQQQILPDRKQFPLIPTSIYGNKQIKGYENVMRSISPESVIKKIKNNL